MKTLFTNPLLVRKLAALVAIAVAGTAVACGGASTTDDTFDLPEREPTNAGDDEVDASKPAPASSAAPAQADASTPPPDAGGGADAASAPPPALCTAPSLVACFSFDNAVKDYGAHAFTPTMLANVTYSPGKDGTAIVLGATSAIRFAPSANWNSATITIDAWVRPTSRANDMTVFDADQRYAMIIRDNGELRCSSAGGSADGGSVPLGVWTHVACVYGAGRVKVFTAGTLRDDESGGAGGSLGAGSAIGGDSPTGAPFIGAIESLRIFGVARTAAQIAATAGGSPN